MKLNILIILILLSSISKAQSIIGVVKAEGEAVPQASVVIKETNMSTRTDMGGKFQFANLAKGSYTIVAFAYGFKKKEVKVNTALSRNVAIILQPLETMIDAVEIQSEYEKTFGVRKLMSVENFGIFEAKKTEVIEMQDIVANTATNNPRQVFAKVAGVNIWESDMAGLQLGIGTRGLSPKRTGNFNTRQNGYDISADALGYPESYYTPPLEAISRIEIVRGAASLQYGTQFGGLLNFRFKKGAKDKKIQPYVHLTTGSWGFFDTFSSIGGTIAKGKLNYYTFYQYKRADGWRPNSKFHSHTAFMGLHYQASSKLKLNADYTYMTYLAKQSGGLTDIQFEKDPRTSIRARNWFKVDWNLLAVNAEYKFNDHFSMNMRNFAVFSGRAASGNLERITRLDNPNTSRTLIKDKYKNFGTELRFLYQYNFFKQKNHLLLGMRVYNGFTRKQQGDIDNSADPVFKFTNPDNLEGSDYDFPSANQAFFVEHIFNFTEKWSITPGIRYEFISTESDGYYRTIIKDRAGNIVTDNRFDEATLVNRNFALLGLGLSFKPTDHLELYANGAQNYRPITFSDLRVNNPNFKLDSNIVDEKGYNMDIGVRGDKEGLFVFDVSGFFMQYQNRIGFVTGFDDRLLSEFRLKTNTGNTTHYGLESFAELNVMRLISPASTFALSLSSNLTFVNAKYTKSHLDHIKDKDVELAPKMLWRGGVTAQKGNFRSTLQYSYVSDQYSDAENTKSQRVPNAVIGLIPAYGVLDFTAAYEFKHFTLEGSVNNILDTHYFTRRADSYPGPGIIPADPRSFFISVGTNF